MSLSSSLKSAKPQTKPYFSFNFLFKVSHRLNCFVEVTCWNLLESPICGSWRTSLKLWKNTALCVSVGLETTFKNSSTNRIFCGDTRITFTLWKNGSQMIFPPPRSGEPCGGARAFVTWCLTWCGRTSRRTGCTVPRARTGMRGWSWLPSRNMPVTLRAHRH